MVSLIYILFICIVAPLLMAMFLLDKKLRPIIGFMILGIAICVFISEINSLLLELFNNDMYFVTTNITPITEEVIKALAVIYFAFVISDNRKDIITIALAVGIGFAIIENCYILVNNIENVTYGWAVLRGFSSGVLHCITTAIVGIGISFVRTKKKLFFTGTMGLLIISIIYHSIYNTLIQSEFDYIAFIMPSLTLIIIVVVMKIKERSKKRVKAVLE